MTAVAVLAASLAGALALALWIRRMDQRDAERRVVAEAERIARTASAERRHPSRWDQAP